MSDLVWVPFASSWKDGVMVVPSAINARGRFLYERKKGKRWRLLPGHHSEGPSAEWLVELAVTQAEFMEYTLRFVEE